MPANDHLGGQFTRPGVIRMPMHAILAMPSAEGDADRPTVGHLIPMKQGDISADTTGHYADIRHSMASSGQTEPLKVTKRGEFKDGHHRVALAQELGWSHMDVRRK